MIILPILIKFHFIQYLLFVFSFINFLILSCTYIYLYIYNNCHVGVVSS